MKKFMSTFILLLLVMGFVFLVISHKPKHPSEAEIKKWLSSKLTEISVRVENDIHKDKTGEYPHAGKQSFKSRGTITYLLADKHNARFDISDKNTLNIEDIKKTDGYRDLAGKAKDMNLTILLEEKEVEGDEVDTFDELDEYIDDIPRYYTVTISGW